MQTMSPRFAMLAAVLLAAAAPIAGAQTSLTIYQDGRVLARRVLAASVPAGMSLHRLALGMLDPGSVFALDTAITVVGAEYDAAVDDQNTMRRAVGRRLVFRASPPRDTVSALVLGVDPERFQLADGTVSFGRPGTPMYPADLVLLDPTLALRVRATSARRSLGLGWFTSGAGWQAAYQVVLGTGSARVAGHAVLQPLPFPVDTATVQLLAGSVGQGRPPSPQYRARELEVAMVQAPMDASATERVGEVYLYTIPGRLTLRPGVVATAALFDPASTPFERTFTVPGSVPYYGPLQQDQEDGQTPVAVTYVLRRPLRTPFGDRPIPAGTVRLYQADEGGRPQLVGEASVGHTAPGQDLRVQAGTAFDLTARRVQTAYATRRDSSRTIATAAYRVSLANARDSAVTVEVLEERGGEWRVLESSVAAESLSSTRTRFRVRVPARGEAVLTYRLQVSW